jgi:ribosomal protein S18 acetylase RimI-like enzyme
VKPVARRWETERAREVGRIVSSTTRRVCVRHNARLNENLTIRAACGADVPSVLALWALARSSHATTPDRPDDVQRLVTEQPGALQIAEIENALVGVLIAAWDGWRGNLYRLAVHPGHRRSAIATLLVEAGETHLRDLGARRITALVAHGDAVATAFWGAAGYPREVEIARHVRSL